MQNLPINDNFTLLAKRYIWWESPAWASRHPLLFLAQVMNLASWDDILLLQRLVSQETLKEVLTAAPPGVFSQRSWDYWHARLNLSECPKKIRQELTRAAASVNDIPIIQAESPYLSPEFL